jgi:hypothetical protein
MPPFHDAAEKTRAAKAAGPQYIVTYGETIPVWSSEPMNWAEAKAFVDEHLSFGDIIFRIELVGKA